MHYNKMVLHGKVKREKKTITQKHIRNMAANKISGACA